jgi:hypothetical protein
MASVGRLATSVRTLFAYYVPNKSKIKKVNLSPLQGV